ncbi:hypothetical protein K2173_000495 [Erythroxylum novogranatense]|uniref:Pentatricopeptide repeat-containing protein n=1 Tax=Erythroxylum novogranatense TaxID=1862640 RepID=A0AAV8SXW9_9ROSI|nr:hypothetical protein K2173_000495 [Erythroxylum novogranatense]
MEGIGRINGHMGIPCFEGNRNYTCSYSWESFVSCGVLSSLRPHRLTMRREKRSNHFGLRFKALISGESDNRMFGGPILEKELEFKTSFDEYLKTLENIKSVRENRRADKSDLDESKDSGRSRKWRRVKGSKEQEKMSKSMEHYELVEDGEGTGGRKRVDEDELHYRKEEMKELNLVSQESFRNVHASRKQGNAARDGKSRRFKGWKEQEKMSTSMEHYELVESREGTAGRKRVVDDQLHYRNVETKELNLVSQESRRNVHINGKQGNAARDVKWLNNQTSSMNSECKDLNTGKQTRKVQKVSFLPKKDEFTGGNIISSKEKWSHVKDFSETLEGKEMTFECPISNVQDNKSNYMEIEQKGALIRSHNFDLEGAEKGGLHIERAAFKHLEGSNDITGKVRVPRAEMEERIQQLAKCLNGADINMPEWMFSKMMRNAKIKYTDHAILRIIQILGKFGNWRRVLQVIEWLHFRERFKAHKLRYVYTTALNVLGKARRPVEALNVFDAMQQQVSSYPDMVAYHSIAVTLGQAGYIKELFDVIDTMRSPPKKKFKATTLGTWDPRLEPDIVVYNAVLNGCVRRKQWEGAFWVLQQLKQQGQQPSIATYGLIMEVMFVCGKYNLVHEFFRKMQKSSIPNALAYRVIVNALWREGKTEEAVLAVEDMERRGIVGSAALYYDLARCLCSAGRCQEALIQIEKICKVATKPLVVTYTGLIQACLDSGDIQNATYIFHEMKHFCSPNLVTCNVMLKAYLQHGLFEEAKKLFHKMLDDANHISTQSDYKVLVSPDIYTFNTMLEACTEEKRWDDLEFVYKQMLHHGYHFNARRHLRLVLDASRAGKKELLEITWKHLARADRNHPSPLIKERFCMMLEKDACHSALDCITKSSPEVDLQSFSTTAWFNLMKENAHRFKKETLVRLMHKAVAAVDSGGEPNPVLQNLLASGNDFLSTC